jgi:Gluconate 2-dehydrogenase subunit 3
MQRREVLKILAAGAALPAYSPSVMAFFQEAQAQVGTAYKLRTLSPQQNAAATAMVDLIIPATDTPGAKATRVNEFIDVILTEWATEDERHSFLSGLAGVDAQSTALFGKNFVEASLAQQTALLRSMDDATMASRGIRRRHHGNTVPEERDMQLRDSFWYVFKGITLHGYYTSEIGFSQEQNLLIIPGAYRGCVPLALEKKA